MSKPGQSVSFQIVPTSNQHAVLTGAIKGTVTLDDGTVVDVAPPIIYVNSVDEAAEVAQLVGERYADEGHPEHEHGEPFVHDAEQTEKNLSALTEGA